MIHYWKQPFSKLYRFLAAEKTVYSNTTCNYHCPECKASGKVPNIAGRFFIINDTECKCNGCDTVFPKSQFYR